MPILREEKIGWCFWELMLGKTQFSRMVFPYQGLIYPDGTCFDASEVPWWPASASRKRSDCSLNVPGRSCKRTA